MARYIGPKSKIARKFENPFSEQIKPLKKELPSWSTRKQQKERKKSEYAIQLLEKQKAKYTYGILERQFRNIFEKQAVVKGYW